MPSTIKVISEIYMKRPVSLRLNNQNNESILGWGKGSSDTHRRRTKNAEKAETTTFLSYRWKTRSLVPTDVHTGECTLVHIHVRYFL